VTPPELPSFDHTKYGRQVAEYNECEGFVVAGHDRRSWAALRNHVHEIDGAPGVLYRVNPERVSVRWVVFEESCGCEPEQHSQHFIKDELNGDWWDCPCEFTGLAPCSDEFSWLSVSSKEDVVGSVPILEWRW
jgi:hypothetical protein